MEHLRKDVWDFHLACILSRSRCGPGRTQHCFKDRAAGNQDVLVGHDYLSAVFWRTHSEIYVSGQLVFKHVLIALQDRFAQLPVHTVTSGAENWALVGWDILSWFCLNKTTSKTKREFISISVSTRTIKSVASFISANVQDWSVFERKLSVHFHLWFLTNGNDTSWPECR